MRVYDKRIPKPVMTRPALAHGHAHSNPSVSKNPASTPVTYGFVVHVPGGMRIHAAVYRLETSLMSGERPSNSAPSGTGMLQAVG